MSTLSVVIQTRNAAPGLAKALASVRWADEIIVADMHSDDATRAIARAQGARVVEVPRHPRVDAVRNESIAQATGDWILVLDADEFLMPEAEAQIRSLIRDAGDTLNAYAIPRFNRIDGQILRGAIWYPDPQTRLFRKGTVRWPDAIHQPPEVVGGPARIRGLENPEGLHIHHDNYADLEAFIERQVRYALCDRYDPDPDRFDLESYLRDAWRQWTSRCDPRRDGDLSRALAVIMAWDRLLRGLIHWNRLAVRPPLDTLFLLPPRMESEEALAALRRLEAENRALRDRLDALTATRWHRIGRRLQRWMPGLMRRLGALFRSPGPPAKPGAREHEKG